MKVVLAVMEYVCFCFIWTILKLISLLRNVYKYIFQGYFLKIAASIFLFKAMIAELPL